MSRNKTRISSSPEMRPEPATSGPLQFVVPTEIVDLPSKGVFYEDGHPLHQSESVEIRYMTAKDEDILTSPSLLQRGMALDRLISSVLIDKDIDVGSLLPCDRNAILVASRITGFGEQYETYFICPKCSHNNDWTFDLGGTQPSFPALEELEKNNLSFENGEFSMFLKKMEITVTLKPLTHKQEIYITESSTRKSDLGLPESITTDTLKNLITSVDGVRDKKIIDHVVDLMPVLDSRQIRKVQKIISPKLKLESEVTCSSCGKSTRMEVPFSTGFFWPDL